MENTHHYKFDDLLVHCSQEIIVNGIDSSNVPDTIKDWLAGKVMRAMPKRLVQKLFSFLIDNRDFNDLLSFREKADSSGNGEFSLMVYRSARQKKEREKEKRAEELQRQMNPNFYKADNEIMFHKGAKVSETGIDFFADEILVDNTRVHVPIVQAVPPTIGQSAKPVSKGRPSLLPGLVPGPNKKRKLQKTDKELVALLDNESFDPTNPDHMISVRSKKSTCVVCGVTFVSKGRLNAHMKADHFDYYISQKPLSKTQEALDQMDEIKQDQVTGFFNCILCSKQFDNATLESLKNY